MNSQIKLEVILNELKSSYQEYESGNSGKSRVHARRAAGFAIKLFLIKQGVELDLKSAIDHIKYLENQGSISTRVRKALKFLTQRVVKDSKEEESYWPYPEINLAEEAQVIIEELLDIKVELS